MRNPVLPSRYRRQTRRPLKYASLLLPVAHTFFFSRRSSNTISRNADTCRCLRLARPSPPCSPPPKGGKDRSVIPPSIACVPPSCRSSLSVLVSADDDAFGLGGCGSTRLWYIEGHIHVQSVRKPDGCVESSVHRSSESQGYFFSLRSSRALTLRELTLVRKVDVCCDCCSLRSTGSKQRTNNRIRRDFVMSTACLQSLPLERTSLRAVKLACFQSTESSPTDHNNIPARL